MENYCFFDAKKRRHPMTERNWGAEEGRAPDLEVGDTLLFSEPGRVLDNVCYRSHYFRLVRSECGDNVLLVKHGGGQERIRQWALRKSVNGLRVLDSDARYLMLYALYQMHSAGNTEGSERTREIYRRAFVDGRLRKRKCKAGVKVWIEPEQIKSSI
jgi:hypothetical protein